MKKIVSETLQGAITQASLELGCSVTELDYEIIQIPSNGFFGLWKRDAIIVAAICSKSFVASNQEGMRTKHSQSQRYLDKTITDTAMNSLQNMKERSVQYAGGKYTEREHFNEKYMPQKHESEEFVSKSDDILEGQDALGSLQSQISAKSNVVSDSAQGYPKENQGISKPPYASQTRFGFEKSDIDEVFFQEIQDPEEVALEVENELTDMFVSMPYKISHISVRVYDEQTLLIELDGDDSALMIGEKGYRYKALSYLLFNWINPRYGYNIRLEIAQFLRNQEEAMDVYLQNIITNVQEFGKAQTKPLDGVLGYIALRKLREIFPNKYVSFRLNALNERYVIVSDFIRNV